MPVKPHRAPAARRLVRLAPAALAAYELHSLFGSVAHAGAALHWLSALSLGSAAPWLLLALALGAGALLREAARGLPRGVAGTRLSPRRAGLWLLWSLALVALLGGGALLGGAVTGGSPHGLTSGFGPVGWASALPAAVLAGLVLSDAFRGARWALHELARLRARPLHTRRRALPVRRFAVTWPPVPVPLLAGWSDRGPPEAALAACAL